MNWADAGGAEAPDRGAPPGLGFDGRLALGGFGAFGATSLLAAEPPPCPGRDRLINFHRPPSGADAPPPFGDDTRKEPE